MMKNKTHRFARRLAMTFLALFTSTMGWAQLSGAGTEASPYLITNATDWNTFAGWINGSNNATYADKYYKMTADIGSTENPFSITVVGTTSNPFKGHFDGGFHSLTISINNTGDGAAEKKAAPFGEIKNATIENLWVQGNITSKKKYGGGIACFISTENTSTSIINCTSSVVIDCSNIERGSNDRPYDCSFGGLVGQNEAGTVNFVNCVFDGMITKGNTTNGVQRCSGFVNWINGTANYTNCAMAGTIDFTKNVATFHRRNNAIRTFTETYYIKDYNNNSDLGSGTSTAIKATSAIPSDKISKKFTVEGIDYYIPSAIITGLENTFLDYTGNAFSYSPVVYYGGQKLVEGTDYTLTVNDVSATSPISITDAGEYNITITGQGSYAGSSTTTITVRNITSWSELNEALSSGSGSFQLQRDFTAESTDGPLTINGTVTLDLNGHTLNRNLSTSASNGCVIKVNQGASLTIEDNSNGGAGVITGGNNSGTGGGIYSEGAFTMTGGSVKNNTSIGGGGGIHAKSGSCTISGCTIQGNTTDSKGGGIRVGCKNTTISNCNISGNTTTSTSSGSEGKGGGVYLDGVTGVNLVNCVITNNTAGYHGGGFYSLYGTATATNCTITGNNANKGGGVYLHEESGKHSNFTMDGGTINNNTSGNEGGGIYVTSGADLKVQGAPVVSGNSSTNTSKNNLYLASSSAVITITGALGENALLGVSRNGATAGAVLTNGLSGKGRSGNFFSDDAQYGFYVSNNEATLGTPVRLSVEGYHETTNKGKWVFIASPIAADTDPRDVAIKTSNVADYDLYRFNQAAELEWENWKSDENSSSHYHFNLENGKGYMYACKQDTTLSFVGVFNENDNKEVGLEYSGTGDRIGWNLVGNPFPVQAYVNRSYYKINGTSLEAVANYNSTAIAACTGVFVHATESGQKVTFSKTAPSNPSNGNLQMTLAQQVTNRGDVTTTTVDNAIVSFNEGSPLEKFVFNADNAKLYIPKNNKEYAIVSANAHGEMPVNFLARENGSYTLTVNPEDVEMNYLHLIDNMTGANIDLLQTPSYSFEAKVTDYESRFRLVFSAQSNEDDADSQEAFAFISNGEIVITADVNDATVQLIDMTGRVIVSRSGLMQCVPTTGMTPGVYVLRLIQGKNIRTQKIIIK